MKNAEKILRPLLLLPILIFAALIIVLPAPCKQGVSDGILLCGRVVIPSLYPFTFCVLYIMRSGAMGCLKFFDRVTKAVFALTAEQTAVVILSLIGGYPVGAKLLGEKLALGTISEKKASIMLNYCINAGPAFVILAVGGSLLGSVKVGVVLLAGHILASLTICFLSRFFMEKEAQTIGKSINTVSSTENFVTSAGDAASAVMRICAFVLLFSALGAYLRFFGQQFELLKTIALFLEITNAVTYTKNIYLISFLLGFAGLSIWCQILSVKGKIKLHILPFVLTRILHGALSALFTAVIIRLFAVTIPTISNNTHFGFKIFYTTPSLAISLVIMGIIFIISLYTKKYAGKLRDEMI